MHAHPLHLNKLVRLHDHSATRRNRASSRRTCRCPQGDPSSQEKMNRRAANGVSWLSAADREARQANLIMGRTTKTRIATGKKQDVTVSMLISEVQVLKKKVDFLQKVDLSVLSDEDSQGDVTFILKNNTVVKAHRFILASRSSIFRKMFGTNMKEKRSGEIQIEDITGPILRAMIEFLYKAEIKFTDEATAQDVLKVAHKYDIPELEAECEAQLVNSVTEDNLSEMLRIAHMYGTKRLMEKCTKVFKENFDRVHSKVLRDLLS